MCIGYSKLQFLIAFTITIQIALDGFLRSRKKTQPYPDKKKGLPKDLSPFDIVVIGHSHQYSNTWKEHPDGRRTLILNPGSCGPRRYYQAITMAVLTVDEDGWIVKRIEIPHEEKGTRLSGYLLTLME